LAVSEEGGILVRHPSKGLDGIIICRVAQEDDATAQKTSPTGSRLIAS
jgi:hypothetical protein